MKLTQEGIDLMVKVREIMTSEPQKGQKTSEFICWNLLIAATGSDECLAGTLMLPKQIREVGGIAYEIFQAIEDAIEHQGSMTLYLLRQIKKKDSEPAYERSVKYSQIARLCWLDRIIETGEIA